MKCLLCVLRVLLSRFAVFVLLLAAAGCHGPGRPSVTQILKEHPEKFEQLLARADEYRLQVALAEVVMDSSGHPTLKRSTFRAGAEYFYPASAIKLCAAIAAVQTIESLGSEKSTESPALDVVPTLDSPLVYHPLFAGEGIRDRDPTHLAGGAITIGHEIRKLFLVSDNEAFNRLYEFVGHRELNEQMWRQGLKSVVINHRLSVSRSPEENRATPRIDVMTVPPANMWTIPERRSDLIVRNASMPGLQVGRGYLAAGRQLRLDPMEFTSRNGMSLLDLQDLLILLARPDIRITNPALTLSNAHRDFLLRTMAEFPGDSMDPRFDRGDFPDEWGKFFLPGLLRVNGRNPSEIRICNKVGQAYGFTIDNAYIEDRRTGRAFFLAATIYTNADGVLNDDAYEYESIAFPFFSDLAEAVADRLWDDSAAKRGGDQSLPSDSVSCR